MLSVFFPLMVLSLLLILIALIMEYGLEWVLGMLAEVADPLIEFLEDLIGLEITEETMQILGLIFL